MCACHVAMRRELDDEGRGRDQLEDQHGRLDPDSELPFHKMYIFGVSTSNQRIERFWDLMLRGQTRQWVEFFGALKYEGLFEWANEPLGETPYDKIAARFLYMTTIRSHLKTFVEMHNKHYIRHQKSREYLAHGSPHEIYHHGGRYYGLDPPNDLFQVLKDEVELLDIEQYQHPETADLCQAILDDAGYGDVFEDDFDLSIILEARHVQAFMALRQGLRDFEADGYRIKQLLSPQGGQRWIAMMEEIEEHRQEALAGTGFMGGAQLKNQILVVTTVLSCSGDQSVP